MKAIIIHTIAFLSSFTFSLAEDKTVNDSSPWKQVAEKAILSMNKGNGDLFTSLAHSELKAEMRKKIIELLPICGPLIWAFPKRHTPHNDFKTACRPVLSNFGPFRNEGVISENFTKYQNVFRIHFYNN